MPVVAEAEVGVAAVCFATPPQVEQVQQVLQGF